VTVISCELLYTIEVIRSNNTAAAVAVQQRDDGDAQTLDAIISIDIER